MLSNDALKNDGWTVTHEQYSIRYKTLKLSVDLAAEQTIAAERAERKIIEEDWTEEGITSYLLAAGVPKEDIVLGFHAPEVRPNTEFAVA